jgi:hypothetical protein
MRGKMLKCSAMLTVQKCEATNLERSDGTGQRSAFTDYSCELQYFLAEES